MSKQNTDPYVVNMNVSLDGLEKIPDGMSGPELFMNIAIGAIIASGKKKGGLTMQEHSKLQRVRVDIENALKVKEDQVSIEFDDFKFLMKCWNDHTPDPQANELVMRVWQLLKDAQSDHDKQIIV